MHFSRKQIIIIAGAVLLLIVLIYLIASNIRQQGSSSAPSVTLIVWGTDSKSALSGVIDSYTAFRSGVKINYRQFDPADYDSQLLDALASGEGPDIFYVGNRAVSKNENRIVGVPASQFDILRLHSLFPTAIEQNFVASGTIYALPLYLDTMVLIYNKDYFDQAALVSPPQTWNDFQADVPRLREIGQNGQITRAAAAIGGSEKTVDAGVDLLNLLMLQNGTQMTSADFSKATFAATAGGFGGDSSSNPGLAAFNFYLQFANAGSPYYTWGDSQDNSLDSFAAGKTAMIFNYHSVLTAIKSKSPYLNFAVSPMPQPKGAEVDVNYPSYDGLAVSKQSKQKSWAWDFIIFSATDVKAQKSYLAATGRPPALRSIINDDLNDPEFSVFAKQALTARSWHDPDDKKVDAIFNTAIQSVLSGQANSSAALDQANDQVGQLLSP